MRKLTFKGFLNGYVRSLSESNTGNIKKLVDEANNGNYRLREPLILWCLLSGKGERLAECAKDTEIEKIYHSFFDLQPDDIMRLLGGSQLPQEFKKVWNSYLVSANSHMSDDETKELIRKRIIELKGRNHISTYRMYKDLGLNPGNLNSWIKNGKENLISLPVARRVLDYLENEEYK